MGSSLLGFDENTRPQSWRNSFCWTNLVKRHTERQTMDGNKEVCVGQTERKEKKIVW